MEQFDESGDFIVFEVKLPLLIRSHAIKLRLWRDFISIVVEGIYKLVLSLPIKIDREGVRGLFHSKVRRLYVFIPKYVEPEEGTVEAGKSHEQVSIDIQSNSLYLDIC